MQQSGQWKLQPGHSALWVSCAGAQIDEHQFALLSSTEQQVCQRLHSTFLQARYTHAHSMVRRILAGFTAQNPGEIVINPGHNKRPYLGDGSPNLDFNLSYSGPWVAVAVAHTLRVGIDIECPEANFDPAAIAGKVLTPEELAWIDALSPEEQQHGFYRLWTLKEACAKAHGEGLGLPFDAMTMLPSAGKIKLDLDAITDLRGSWRAWEFKVASDANLALSLVTFGLSNASPLINGPCPAEIICSELLPGPDGSTVNRSSS